MCWREPIFRRCGPPSAVAERLRIRQRPIRDEILRYGGHLPSRQCGRRGAVRQARRTRSPQRGVREGEWRRGESNPRPKSATARRLHAYRIRFVSPAAFGTRKTRDRLVRLISPEDHGPRSAGQPTVWRLDPSPWTKLGETGYARFF